VDIPTHLNVTQLASSGDCSLKAIVSSSAYPDWPPSPEAEFGSVVHSLMDLAARGEISVVNSDARAVDQALDQLLRDAQVRLSSNPATRDFADLHLAFSPREWQKRRSLAIARTMELLTHQTVGRVSDGTTGSKQVPFAGCLNITGFTASEVTLESKVLRIRARIDFVSVSTDGVVEITDFKSGNVLDDEGEVDEVTSLQLRLYGLAILELVPQARIQLTVVSRGGTAPVAFSDADIQSTREWLDQKASQLPEGSSIEAEQVAVVGTQCWGCKARVVCPNYRSSIADLWKKADSSMALPFDIAGHIVEDTSNGNNNSTTLRIADLAGRIVKVHRLSQRSWPQTDFERERVFWFFNLAASESSMQHGRWRHPRNFHELPESTLERRAWMLRVYKA